MLDPVNHSRNALAEAIDRQRRSEDVKSWAQDQISIDRELRFLEAHGYDRADEWELAAKRADAMQERAA